MRLSLDWLNDHVDLAGLTPEAVGELFTLRVAAVDEKDDLLARLDAAAGPGGLRRR